MQRLLVFTIALASCGYPALQAIGVDAGGGSDGGTTGCTTAADCTDPTKPFCEGSVCVAACGSDGDCAGTASTPYCSAGGACVACLDNSACGGATPVCDTATNTCVGCLDDTECTSAQAPVCDAGAHVCRGCEQDTECSSGICLESNGTCAGTDNAVFVRDNGTDAGTCSEASPCATLPFAIAELGGGKNVVKILSTSYSVASTVRVQFTGYIDGTMTTLSGGGSNGTFEVDGGDLVLSGMTIDPIESYPYAVNVKGGRVLLYGVTSQSDIEVNGGELDLDAATVQEIDCGEGGSAGGTITISKSSLARVWTYLCSVTLERNVIDQTSLAGNGGLVDVSGGTFVIENNTMVSNNPLTDAVQLGGSGGRFRFNTMVNLSGENETATPIACDGAEHDISNNIIAWNTSTPPQDCDTTYTLYDNFEALPPGTGNQIGSAATFFVDMANKDFHLASGSPAIGAADPGACTSIMIDHDGSARPGSACDVGAYESP